MNMTVRKSSFPIQGFQPLRFADGPEPMPTMLISRVGMLPRALAGVLRFAEVTCRQYGVSIAAVQRSTPRDDLLLSPENWLAQILGVAAGLSRKQADNLCRPIDDPDIPWPVRAVNRIFYWCTNPDPHFLFNDDLAWKSLDAAWQVWSPNDFPFRYVADVCRHPDESYALFSRIGNTTVLGLSATAHHLGLSLGMMMHRLTPEIVSEYYQRQSTWNDRNASGVQMEFEGF